MSAQHPHVIYEARERCPWCELQLKWWHESGFKYLGGCHRHITPFGRYVRWDREQMLAMEKSS